ncbi:hypothetical protein ADUPG1_004903, partial [Aduncisulcus paluster]
VIVAEDAKEAETEMTKLFDKNMEQTEKRSNYIGPAHWYVWLKDSQLRVEQYARENIPEIKEETERHEKELVDCIVSTLELDGIHKNQVQMPIRMGGIGCATPKQHTEVGARRWICRLLNNERKWFEGDPAAFILSTDDASGSVWSTYKELLQGDLERAG